MGICLLTRSAAGVEETFHNRLAALGSAVEDRRADEFAGRELRRFFHRMSKGESGHKGDEGDDVGILVTFMEGLDTGV